MTSECISNYREDFTPIISEAKDDIAFGDRGCFRILCCQVPTLQKGTPTKLRKTVNGTIMVQRSIYNET